jgi:hypothetical protein
MQMSAQYHFDLLFNKAVDRALCAAHGDIEDTIVPGCKLMMDHNDADLIVGHSGKRLFAMLKLMAIESAVRDAAPWRCGIETNQHYVTNVQDRI